MILPQVSLNYTILVYLICVITIIYSSFSTLRTTDIKELIAYSSVAHAAVYLLSILLMCLQLPNSGNILKLLVLNKDLTVIGGLSNYSFIVISQNIQYYLVVGLSSPRNFTFLEKRRYYVTFQQQSSVENFSLRSMMSPFFVDGEGCFHVNISKNKKYKLGWAVRLCFTLTQYVRDHAQLVRIRNVIGVGKIFNHGPRTLQLKVESQEDLGGGG